MADAAQTQRDGDLARHHPDDRDGDGVRGHLAPPLDEEVVVLTLPDVDAAAAAADDDPGARLRDAKRRVAPRLARRDDGDERRARIALGIGAVARVPDIVALERRHIVDRHVADRRGDATGEIGCIEVGDGARPAAPLAHVLPEALTADAERRDDADTGDDDPREH